MNARFEPLVEVRDSKVLVFTEEPIDLDNSWVEVSEKRYGFERDESYTARPLPADLLAGCDTIAPVEQYDGADEGFIIDVNISPEWTLQTKEFTPYIEISDRETEKEFFYHSGDSWKTELPDGPYILKGLFGVHRAKTEIVLRIFDEFGDELQSQRVAVDPRFLGGTNAEDFFELFEPIPSDPRRHSFSVSLKYKGTEDLEANFNPFIFIGECSVVPADSDSADGQPASIILGPGREGGLAYVCKVGATAFDTEPKRSLVVLNGEEHHALKFEKAVIRCEVQSGSFVAVRASVPGEYTLYIDDAFSRSFYLETSEQSFRIDSRFFDGNAHRLSIFDKHGMVRYFDDYVFLPEISTPLDALQTYSKEPYPSHLSPAARFRYQSLAARVAAGGERNVVNFKTFTHAHKVLELGPEALCEFELIRFQKSGQPEVSIVIPAHNQFKFTYYCLCALLFTAGEVPFEVIVVDDGSTDETEKISDIVEGIRVVRHETAQGFIRACNAGAARAKGKYVLLLNNDTEPTHGWLEELTGAFERFDEVGLVGAKLLNNDGTLQDAGGIIWSNGNPWNYGRDQNPWDPRFCYARDADYVTGAAMMTSKEIWDELGGLSDYLEPMYFEDTDFAFKVRASGRRVMFIPQARIFHFEGKTGGTDVSSGMKRYQEINRPKFMQTWIGSYRGHGIEAQFPDLEKDRAAVGRVACIDYSVPRPDMDAGGYAMVQEMRLLTSLGFKVTFVPSNLAHLGAYTEDLNRQGIEQVHAPFYSSLEDFLARRAAEFDAFYVTRYQVFRVVIDSIRRYAPKAKVLFNNADLHFLRELRTAIHTKDNEEMQRALLTRDEEFAAIRAADVTLSYNEVEHSVIISHALDDACLVKCPWVVEVHQDTPGLENRSGLSFVGSYQHAPNVSAVEFFASQVMPKLNRRHPGLNFHVYGSSMGDRFDHLASDTIHIDGYAPDINHVYDAHRIFVAPLLAGAGIKGKVLQALASGTPAVLSPIAAEGIGLRNRLDCLICEKPEEWVSAISRLMGDDTLWHSLRENGMEFAAEHYSFERGRNLMRSAFATAGIYTPF